MPHKAQMSSLSSSVFACVCVCVCVCVHAFRLACADRTSVHLLTSCEQEGDVTVRNIFLHSSHVEP